MEHGPPGPVRPREFPEGTWEEMGAEHRKVVAAFAIRTQANASQDSPPRKRQKTQQDRVGNRAGRHVFLMGTVTRLENQAIAQLREVKDAIRSEVEQATAHMKATLQRAANQLQKQLASDVQKRTVSLQQLERKLAGQHQRLCKAAAVTQGAASSSAIASSGAGRVAGQNDADKELELIEREQTEIARQLEELRRTPVVQPHIIDRAALKQRLLFALSDAAKDAAAAGAAATVAAPVQPPPAVSSAVVALGAPSGGQRRSTSFSPAAELPQQAQQPQSRQQQQWPQQRPQQQPQRPEQSPPAHRNLCQSSWQKETRRPAGTHSPSSKWACTRCTYLNIREAVTCSMCGGGRVDVKPQRARKSPKRLSPTACSTAQRQQQRDGASAVALGGSGGASGGGGGGGGAVAGGGAVVGGGGGGGGGGVGGGPAAAATATATTAAAGGGAELRKKQLHNDATFAERLHQEINVRVRVVPCKTPRHIVAAAAPALSCVSSVSPSVAPEGWALQWLLRPGPPIPTPPLASLSHQGGQSAPDGLLRDAQGFRRHGAITLQQEESGLLIKEIKRDFDQGQLVSPREMTARGWE